ncbi:MAG: hypothetical protein IPL21_07390 [Saprospirales bacterium]|nr:hypothetical protein [Saprospirales bacterium]
MDNIDEHSSRQLIIELSQELTTHVGKGFSRSNLIYMRLFFLNTILVRHCLTTQKH